MKQNRRLVSASAHIRTKAYNAWVTMRQRCNNPNNPKYKNYGGRGIKVCDRWNSFDNFLADMGQPFAGRSLDRIDNNGNYCKENCRWATDSEQNLNRRAFKRSE